MDQPLELVHVYFTVLGRPGGMDSVADLTTEMIGEAKDLKINITRLTTRGGSGFLSGSLIFLGALTKLWLAGRQGKVDLLHLNTAAGGSAYRKLILARVARHLGIPYVIHLHGSRFHEFWPSLGGRARKAVDGYFLQSARILVLGRFWAHLITEYLPSVRDKLEILPNATKSVSASRDHHPRQAVQISCLGLLGARKGTPQLIEALALLKDRDDWRVTIAGNGEVDAARAKADTLGIADRVDIPGWLDARRVENLLGETDILVLPSFAENLPMSILEGFARGIAVIATPVGAIPEIIDDQRNGLIVPAGDVEALAKAIRRLIENPALRRRLGDAARQDHAARYEISAYVQRLAAIWRSQLRSKALGRPAAS